MKDRSKRAVFLRDVQILDLRDFTNCLLFLLVLYIYDY